jgi:DNA polymerase-3 subunit epsilon
MKHHERNQHRKTNHRNGELPPKFRGKLKQSGTRLYGSRQEKWGLTHISLFPKSKLSRPHRGLFYILVRSQHPFIMSDKFVAIDFETANADLASICQVGVVTFENGRVVESWGSLVNPQDYFDRFNIAIHGIDEAAVKDAPTFQQIYTEILSRLQGNVVVCHTSFDRSALSQAIAKHNLSGIPCQWLDSARVVRRAWAQWSHKGYGLTNVCGELGISYIAHDAIEDARAAGEVLLRVVCVKLCKLVIG